MREPEVVVETARWTGVIAVVAEVVEVGFEAKVLAEHTAVELAEMAALRLQAVHRVGETKR